MAETERNVDPGGIPGPMDVDHRQLPDITEDSDKDLTMTTNKRQNNEDDNYAIFQKKKPKHGTLNSVEDKGAKPKVKLLDNQPKSNDKTKLTFDGWIKNTIYTTFFIEPLNISTTNNIASSNPITNQKYIHIMEIAKMLHNIGIREYKELTQAGRARFKIKFHRPTQAEPLLNSKLLTDTFKYKIYVPNMFKQTIGIIRNIPQAFTEEEIKENISSNKKIEKVERIMRLKEDRLVPTYTVKIFVEGDKLPEEVKIYGIVAKVEVYLFPLKVCQNCWRFGHKAKACKAKVRCETCGLEHETKLCNSSSISCVNCKGKHLASDRDCPERLRQDKIRSAMATEKLTFAEAARKIPKNKIESVQYRINSVGDFPTLGNASLNQVFKKYQNLNPVIHSSKPKSMAQIIRNTYPQPEIVPEPAHEFKENPHKTTEFEKFIQDMKEIIIQELNIGKLIQKVKEIQNEIKTTTNKNVSDWQSDLLLIKINEELNSLFNTTQQH